jgi:integrase
MNRPRKQNRELPACVYLKHGSYFYVKNGKWNNLGKDKKAALVEYAKQLTRPKNGMGGLIYRWFEDAEISDGSKPVYKSAAKALAKAFAEFEPHEVTARDVLALMHHYRKTPSRANLFRAVLSNVLDFGFMENVVERNIVKDVKPYKMKARDRYLSDAEFNAVRAAANPVLQSMMDMLYLTGQRISDIIAIRHADLLDDGIAFKQKKTGHKMVVALTDELRVAVAEAKKTATNIKGMTLYSHRNGKPWSYSSINKMWLEAVRKVGIENAKIHDIRAKSATDAEEQGLDSKKLLGHQSESSHQRYLRSKKTAVAIPVSFRQK